MCNEISTLTVNYVRIINHFSTSLITYCKPWRNGINNVKRTQFSQLSLLLGDSGYVGEKSRGKTV